MGPLQYVDFDIRLSARDGAYVASVQSDDGVVETTFTLPYSDDRLELLIVKLGHTRARTRRSSSPELKIARELGGALYNCVFTGPLGEAYRASLHAAAAEGRGLRIRLLHQEVPRLGDLPWELLYDPVRDDFLANSNRTPIVRFLALDNPVHPLRTARPLRLLVMVSHPTDAARLDVAHEETLLRDALARLVETGQVEIDWIHDATVTALQRALQRGPYHVFHFVGHGGFDADSQQGVLVLENAQERREEVTAHRIATLLRDHPSLRLAVLNACEGARNSRDDSFAGVATTMVRLGIPAVIAMQFEITDHAALTFSREFYCALAEGMPVDGALAEARKAIYAEPNDTEWATPVLYTHTQDGVLFQLTGMAAATAHAAAREVSAGSPAATAHAAAREVSAGSPAASAPAPAPAGAGSSGGTAVGAASGAAPAIGSGAAPTPAVVLAEAMPSHRSPWRRFRELARAAQAVIVMIPAVLGTVTFVAARDNAFDASLQAASQRMRTGSDAAQRALAVRELAALGTSKKRATRVAGHLYAFAAPLVPDTLQAFAASPCVHGAARATYRVLPQDLQAAVLALARMHLITNTTANLRGAYLPGLAADDTPLRNLVLTSTCLRGAQLKELDHVRLDSAELDSTNLEQVRLRHAHLRATSFRGADLTNAQLASAILRRADFTGATLRYADLSFTIAAEADFTRADLFCADLTFAHLEAAVFDSVSGWHEVQSLASAYLYDAAGLNDAQLGAAAGAGAVLDTIPPLRRDSARVLAAAARDPRRVPCR